ncbi:receptor-type tyrosine-protein phosphatase eta isoform X3 [Plectropomus leopardus]|uniref:receptor-type tyrosine-protein phosphatase eta isoform X3 n=1 Tax=Plectropomus leopardus TaxID=160734 RepID=UPI001C4AF3E8|nr:receptor-type tyrosine-protein phosphatase eta isoform X3 [Plectropomus leopardus]
MFHCHLFYIAFASLSSEPEVVRNLNVSEITTSSVSLTWTKPEGKSSFYRVQWTDGNVTDSGNVTEAHINITNLTAGVQYEITVTAVAGDSSTEGRSEAVSQYTKPEVVRNLNVSEITTSSVSLSWTEPEGKSSFYRVQWIDGNLNHSRILNETHINITDLTAGEQYNFTIVSVAGDQKTLGEAKTISLYTKPEVVRNLNVSEITTSSISLMWTKPEGKSSFYRVQWTHGNVTGRDNVTEAHKNITNLTAGVQYEITVTAVAGDSSTEGRSEAISQYTRPGQIGKHTDFTNTSSIFVNWTSPPGEVFLYRVEWHNNGVLLIIYTNNTFTVLSDLIPGTTYIITITAIAGDNRTKGEGYTFNSVTKPAKVGNLSITNVTTTSVSLDWTNLEGNATSYFVQWTAGRDPISDTTNVTFFIINNLIPGSQYNITVAAVAVNPSNKGEETLTTTFTKPEKPENIMIVSRGTGYLKINWTLPKGRADHYVVNISNERLMYSNITADTSALFTNLLPGRIYVITVTSVAGDLSEISDSSLFATEPTPPGSIIIVQRTNSSLHLKWATPAMMEGAPNIGYHIKFQTEGGEVQNKSTSVNYTELSSLSSGTSYNITVQTVGPQNLWSTVIHNSAFTLPNPVLNLKASPKSTTSVEVKWSDPQGFKPHYKYLVKAYNNTGALFSQTAERNSIDVPSLEPGTRYDINVTTIAAAESESTVEQTFSYTMPKAVTNLEVGVSTRTIHLTWLRQSDHKASYSYLVIALQDAKMVQNDSTQVENYTFTDLTPGTLYTFDVFTVVEGVRSEVESTSNYTEPESATDITAIGSTTTMTVSWTQAVGEVGSYTILLYKGTMLVRNATNLSNTTVKKEFLNLTPGVLYCVEVITKSGPYEIANPHVCNATFPTPPGSIEVESQTVESINFTWGLPNGMDHNQYNFSVSTFNGSFLTGNNWFLLDKLQSGSPYSISVVTVGVKNYESTAVTTQKFTRPYPVTKLRPSEITTNAMTLVWEQLESKPQYSYVVQTTNGSFSQNETVLNKTITITGLLSGSNYSFTVTTQAADGTPAAPETVSYFTRPHGIRQLEAETLNTSAVRLVWMTPLEYKTEYTYRVETTGCGSKNNTLAENYTEISQLTAGTNCTFCVFVRAENDIEGEAHCTSQYTKPEAVQPSITSAGSNSSILVSWTKPSGNVERYKVYLNSTATSLKEAELDSTKNSTILFDSLPAGSLYTAVVFTHSGPFKASSEFITNATFPNPPGAIDIQMKTNGSIYITWEEAPGMSSASFHYLLTDLLSPGGEYITANTTSHNFTSLLSGTSYNISVATVGVMDFKSEKVQVHMVTTRPFSVKYPIALPAEESITVKWAEPDEYKESYRYNLTWKNSDGRHGEKLIKENETKIESLVPGTLYDIGVTTQTFDGTEGATIKISSCTNASPVKNLVCEAPNTTNAKVILSWVKPSGRHSGFQVTVNDGEIINSTNICCTHTVSGLRHYTQYSLTVETQSCGRPSTPTSVLCQTGITNPPVPDNSEKLVKVDNKEHYRFSLQIDSSLLDNTSGPITYVGVLVTDKIPGDTSNLTKYLGKTYEQWKSGDTSVYLATVRKNSFPKKSRRTVREIISQSRNGGSFLNIDIGDKTTWEGYTNGVLDANKDYRYAIALFTSLNLQNKLVDLQVSLVSVTQFYPAVSLPQNPVVIGIAVGATLGIFCVLFIILIGFIVYWKRLSNKESSDIQIHSLRSKVSVEVRVEDYEAYYKKQKADSNCGFAEEFEDLKLVGTAQSKTNALTLENKPKNRYNNVLPYDSSRVKLSIVHGSPYDDYINANYMPGYNSRKEFIAAQGPLPTTVNDFWRMIWEKNVQTLVMLTRCNEQGRVKCEQYWASGIKHFENITVTTTSEIPLEDWTIRDFTIKNVKTAETRSVRHFHFTAWPDHGVPQTTELLISFRHLVREHMDQYSRHSPTVVHCSAGVGRTGTFIAIDRLIFQIERENIVDVYGIVHDLRMHRPLMVQTEDQYVFLNQCAMDIIRSRTGTNVDLIYQNTAALSIYENIEPKKSFPKNGYRNS